MKSRIVPRFYMGRRAVPLMRCFHCGGYHKTWEALGACAERRKRGRAEGR